MSGAFITFEGPEGAGKTTQLKALYTLLSQAGHSVCVTREPGGTKGGEALRALLLNAEYDWSPLAEALLMNAARDLHIREIIVPALNANQIVLCDRFALSTRAYQGGGGNLDKSVVDSLEKAVCTRIPDLTLVFDLPPTEGLARAAARGQADRFEAKSVDYHHDVAAVFRAMAHHEKHARIDATGTMEKVTVRVRKAVHAALPNLL